MKQRESSWDSHNDHFGSTYIVALLHNPVEF